MVAVASIPLSLYEHLRSPRPSFLLEGFLLLSLLFEPVRARTFWLLHENHTIPVIFICTVVLKAVSLTLEMIEKRRFLLPESQNCSPEETSGTVSRAFFAWLYPILRAGYKGTLHLRDLFVLDAGLKTETLSARFEAAWDAVPNREAKGALFGTWIKVLEPTLLAPIIPRLFLSGFTYAQPFLVNEAVGLAVLPEGQPYDNYGYGLIVAFIFVYFGLAVCLSHISRTL